MVVVVTVVVVTVEVVSAGFAQGSASAIHGKTLPTIFAVVGSSLVKPIKVNPNLTLRIASDICASCLWIRVACDVDGNLRTSASN